MCCGGRCGGFAFSSMSLMVTRVTLSACVRHRPQPHTPLHSYVCYEGSMMLLRSSINAFERGQTLTVSRETDKPRQQTKREALDA